MTLNDLTLRKCNWRITSNLIFLFIDHLRAHLFTIQETEMHRLYDFFSSNNHKEHVSYLIRWCFSTLGSNALLIIFFSDGHLVSQFTEYTDELINFFPSTSISYWFVWMCIQRHVIHHSINDTWKKERTRFYRFVIKAQHI